MRDLLRQDEGSVPDRGAYTLAELSVLARSAVAAQRVAAVDGALHSGVVVREPQDNPVIRALYRLVRLC